MGDVARGPSIAIEGRQTGRERDGFGGLRAWPARLEVWFEAERTQLPFWLPVGVVAGVAAWFWLPSPAAWSGFLLAMAALAVAGFAFGRGGRTGRALALFALAMLVGCGLIWIRSEHMESIGLERAQVARVTARVETVEPLPAREATRLLLHPLDPADGLPPRARLAVTEADVPAGLLPGAVVALRARLVRPPTAAVPGAYDYSAVAWFQGIGATGHALEPVRIVIPAPRGGPREWLADVRIALARHILSHLPGGPGGVAVALVTGDMAR